MRNLSLSGWLEEMVKNKHDPCTDPQRGYLDLEEHDPLPPQPPQENQDEDEEYEPSIMGEDEMI